MRNVVYARQVFALVVGGWWLVLTSAGPAAAQGSLQIPLQFDFLNPGARSLALGSAFAGLADDATAGFTNPAGLTALTLPEVSFEVRGRRLESPFLRGGRLSGPVSMLGVDTRPDPDYGISVAESAGPSYVSFVFPAAQVVVDWLPSRVRSPRSGVRDARRVSGFHLPGIWRCARDGGSISRPTGRLAPTAFIRASALEAAFQSIISGWTRNSSGSSARKRMGQ